MMHIGLMKLQEYMKLKGLNDEEMAALIGKERTLVSKYRRGKVEPPLEVIAAIEEATERAVSFQDFLTSGEAA